MTINDGDNIRASFRMTGSDGQDIVNVYHYQADFTAAASDQDVADAINDHLDNAYGNCNDMYTNALSPVDLKIDIVNFVSGVEKIVRNVGLFVFAATNFVPGGTGDALPPQDSALVKFLTGIGKVYGRKYLGQLVEAAQNAGTPSATLLTRLTAFAATILAGGSVAGSGALVPGVMSEKQADFVAFTEADYDNPFSGQRRRRVGSGS